MLAASLFDAGTQSTFTVGAAQSITTASGLKLTAVRHARTHRQAWSPARSQTTGDWPDRGLPLSGLLLVKWPPRTVVGVAKMPLVVDAARNAQPQTNMNKHTPGPWTVHDNIGRKGELGITADADPCIIAIMGNQKEWPNEARANARLIASAPDLLDALEAILQDYDPKKDETLAEMMGPCGASKEIKRNHARQAIAKAKGEL